MILEKIDCIITSSQCRIISICENAFKNIICKIWATLFQPLWVQSTPIDCSGTKTMAATITMVLCYWQLVGYLVMALCSPSAAKQMPGLILSSQVRQAGRAGGHLWRGGRDETGRAGHLEKLLVSSFRQNIISYHYLFDIRGELCPVVYLHISLLSACMKNVMAKCFSWWGGKIWSRNWVMFQ